MVEVGEIVLAVFAIFGVYALFCRVLVLLLGRDSLVTGLCLRGDEGEDTVAALLAAAALSAERDTHKNSRFVVLLSDIPDEGTMRFLMKENLEIYLPIGRREESFGKK